MLHRGLRELGLQKSSLLLIVLAEVFGIFHCRGLQRSASGLRILYTTVSSNSQGTRARWSVGR